MGGFCFCAFMCFGDPISNNHVKYNKPLASDSCILAIQESGSQLIVLKVPLSYFQDKLGPPPQTLHTPHLSQRHIQPLHFLQK